MTNELKRTLTFAAVAAVMLAITAAVTWPRGATSAEAFQDQGETFFPEFNDPRAAAALEVIDYDPETASAIPFKVAKVDGKWVIPSHHNYPADAEEQLAGTAAGVIDLTKDAIASDSAELHEEMGVIDPLDTKVINLKGRGKRVTLKDEKGRVLADFIIGNAVPGQENQRYVRVPGQKRTYKVNVDVDLSARFNDWIETNLLQLNPTDIRRLTIDNHSVDPERGTVQTGDVLTLERKTPTDPWVLDEPLPPGKELDTSKLSTMTSALGDLKIAGVRAKPSGLTSELKAQATGEGNVSMSSESIRSLAARGFYLTRDGRLLSNQGDVFVATNEGVVYILRFGEITFATGEALTAGADEETKGSPDPNEEKKPEGATESRYLFVTAQFEPELIAKPDALREAEAAERNTELPARRLRSHPRRGEGRRRARRPGPSGLRARDRSWQVEGPGAVRTVCPLVLPCSGRCIPRDRSGP